MKNIKQRLEKYSERFDNKDNEIVEGIFNPETWGKRVLTEEDVFNQKDIDAVTDYISKEQQKQHLIDMMKQDEELGLYDEPLRKQFPANIEGSEEFNEMCKEDFNLTKADILELMRRAYNAGYNQYNIVEAGLEGKDTEENVRWILTKYQSEKLENSKRKRNFYCGDKVDYDEQCLEQCDRCVDCTGVDYGYYDEN
jgi:tRNA/tmRNA/rRNA uracil-C5-methylase (TrmA/RlmC/RlmD family)